MIVIKCGGSSLETLGAGFVSFLKELHKRESVILVHGGGPAIAALEKRLGIASRFSPGGQRITDDATLEIVVQVLCGTLNSRLVSLLCAGGLRAFGLSGFSGDLLQARLKDYARLGWVGEPVSVKPEILQWLCGQGFLPVVAPVSLMVQEPESPEEANFAEIESKPGQLLNVNADAAAAAIAKAVGAKSMIFISDVPGIMDGDGQLCPTLRTAEVRAMIRCGTIYGGMIPKVEGALLALEQNGLERVWIMDGAALQNPIPKLAERLVAPNIDMVAMDEIHPFEEVLGQMAGTCIYP